LFPENRKKEMDEFEEFWRKKVILTHITTKIKPSFFFQFFFGGEGRVKVYLKKKMFMNLTHSRT